MTQKKISVVKIFGASLMCLFSFGAHAQTNPDGQWHGRVVIGGSYASSNTNVQSFNALADATRATQLDKTSLYTLANYGSNTTNNVRNTTAKLFRVGGRYDYNLSADSFYFGGGEFENNQPQNIQSRYVVNTGAGYKMIRTPETSFDVFYGLGYAETEFSRYSPPKPGIVKGIEFLFGEESSHKINNTSSFKQKWVIYPSTSNNNGFRSTIDMGLATVVANGWTLNVGVNMSYTSKPSAGFPKNSRLISFGFGYKY
jgi:putative salt-induced outer membrane protein YdiY